MRTRLLYVQFFEINVLYSNLIQSYELVTVKLHDDLMQPGALAQ